MILYYIVKSSSATVEGDFLFNGTIWFNSYDKGDRNLTGTTSYFPVHIFL
mgnify:CR=1 FL=1